MYTISNGGITIGDDAWIGTNALILGGVKVGQGAVVGAGSIVTKDIHRMRLLLVIRRES